MSEGRGTEEDTHLEESDRSSSRRTAVLVALIVLLALSVRVLGIHFDITYGPDEEKILPMALAFHDRGLNPHFFNYPTFHMYIIYGISELYFLLGKVLGSFPDYRAMVSTHLKEIYLIARMLTALMGSATAILVYLAGKHLYGRDVGLIGASFLAVLPAHVWDSHYVTVDVLATFWLALSFLFIVKVYKSGGYRWYILSALSAGLGTATKYNVAFVMLALVVVHVLRERNRRAGTLGVAIAVFLLAFFAGCPYSLLDYREFLRDFIFEYQHVRRGHYGFDIEPRGWIYNVYIYQLFAALPFSSGILFHAVSMAGLVQALLRHRREDLVVLSVFIPYLLVVGSWNYVPIRYYLLIAPFVCLFGARFLRSLGPTKIVLAVSGAVFAYTLVYCLSTTLRFTSETRDEARAWIEQNVPAGSRIVIGPFNGYYPPLNSEKYQVVQYDCVVELADHAQEGVDSSAFSPVLPDVTVELVDLMHEDVDYVILSSLNYMRPYRDPERYRASVEFYESLRKEQLGYHMAESFSAPYLNRGLYSKLDPMFWSYFWSPTIEIYRRNTQ